MGRKVGTWRKPQRANVGLGGHLVFRGSVSCLLAVMVGFLLAGCRENKYFNSEIQGFTELVLAPGMTITATNRNGRIEIEAGQGTVRKYTWEGATREVKLMVRYSRYHGSLGIYSPGDVAFAEHHGITRAVVEEGQMKFDSEEQALAWLNEPYQIDILDRVYNNDGLVVGWGRSPKRKQLNVDVWQIYIGGKKPMHLSGADDLAVSISSSAAHAGEQ